MKSLRQNILSKTTLNFNKIKPLETNDMPVPMSISDIVPMGDQTTSIELQGVKKWEAVCETLLDKI